MAAVAAIMALGIIGLTYTGTAAPTVPHLRTAEELAQLPDAQITYAVIEDLRWRLVAAGEDDWRTLPPAGLQMMALSWTEPSGPATPVNGFRGFAELASRQSAAAPRLGEIALAYEAIGASEVAAIVRRAESRQLTEPSGTGAMAPSMPRPGLTTAATELDVEFGKACLANDTPLLVRRYIRAHLTELTTFR